MRVWVGVAAGIVLALAGAPYAGAGATFTVTRLDDPAADGCMPMDCSLREAVLAANADPDRDAILLPAGHFRLTIPGPGVDATAGDLNLTEDVTITGVGARLTVIDAQGIDRVFDVSVGVTAEIDDVMVTGGQTPFDGAGISSAGMLTLLRDAVSANSAGGNGGGISSLYELSIEQSTISANRATFGGGIAFGGTARIRSSTLAGNVAGGAGTNGMGGAIEDPGNGALVLSSSTVTDNRSYNSTLDGGGLEVSGAIVDNSIIANNVSYLDDQGLSAVSNCAGSVLTSAGHNLSDGTDCGFTQPGDQQGVPVLLGALADNGGPTDTEAVLPASLALDAGAGCLAIDQRSVSRPRGSACEIGAYEFAPPLVTSTAATSVGFSTATMTGTVDPSVRETTAWFEYGRTTEYGSTTPVRYVGAGNGAMSFTEPLSGLRQGTTYHYRLVAANAEGRIVGADQSFTTMDRQKPMLTLLRVVPGLFHRKNGATFSFTLTENATVTLRFDHVLRGVRRGKRCVKITRRNRRHRPCTRYLPVAGSLVLSAAEGKNSTHFDAKVGQKLLTFGAYRVRATPKDGVGNVGKTALAAFRVLR